MICSAKTLRLYGNLLSNNIRLERLEDAEMVLETGAVCKDEAEAEEVVLMGMPQGRLCRTMQVQNHNKHHQRQKMRLLGRRRRLQRA